MPTTMVLLGFQTTFCDRLVYEETLMKSWQRFVKGLALTAAVLFLSACASPLAAQENSWKGETVLHTKPSKEIRFVDRLGEGEMVLYSFSGIWPFTVREEKDGWLRVHDRYHEGWV